MRFEACIPTSRAGKFVDLLWYAETDQMFSGKTKILPDGVLQIIINLGPTQYLIDDESKKGFHEGWITGQRTRPIEVEMTSDYRALGIRFKSTGIFPFLEFPASELTNDVIELDNIWNDQFSLLKEQLLETPDVRNKFRIVEQFLAARLQKAEEAHAAIDYTTRLLRQPTSEVTVREAAEKMNISHKHLIRLFKKHVGLSPKLYQRIFRFQHILNKMNDLQGDFSEILDNMDYYDQSHYNREFKQFTGLTPNQYFASRKSDPHSLFLD